MIQEISYGIIPVRKKGKQWEVLLVSPHHGYWGLPKGHAELQETPLDTATRELFEETALSIVQILSKDPISEIYTFRIGSKLIHKQVDYFLAEVEGDVLLQKEEMRDSKWMNLREAIPFATYLATKQVLEKAVAFLFPKGQNEK